MVTGVSVPPMFGLRGAKLPVRDIDVSSQWYSRALGWERVFEFPDETGAVVGVGGRLPGQSPARLAFRRNPDARAQEGLELSIAVETKDDLQRWVEHLDLQGVPHSPVIDATISWLVVLKDPDGHEIHLMTHELHGIDQDGRPGYGRLAAGAQFTGLESP
jgi:catechol 2,3-dioxygenase-like lactoylglutathione lyase family enzyme